MQAERLLPPLNRTPRGNQCTCCRACGHLPTSSCTGGDSAWWYMVRPARRSHRCCAESLRVSGLLALPYLFVKPKVVVARSLDLAVSFDSVDRHGQCGHQAVGPASASDLPTGVEALLLWVVPRRKSSGTLSASVASSSSPIGPSILPRSRPPDLALEGE